MPMLRMAMYSKGIQLYCAPTADDRETWLPTMRHIALEGRCFVLTACQYIKRGSFPADYPAVQGDDPNTVLMRGGSCIIDPLGRVLAGPSFEGECILTADIDLDEIPARQVRLRRGGPLRPAGRLPPLRQRTANPAGHRRSAVEQRRNDREEREVDLTAEAGADPLCGIVRPQLTQSILPHHGSLSQNDTREGQCN